METTNRAKAKIAGGHHTSGSAIHIIDTVIIWKPFCIFIVILLTPKVGSVNSSGRFPTDGSKVLILTLYVYYINFLTNGNIEGASFSTQARIFGQEVARSHDCPGFRGGLEELRDLG